MQDNTRNLDPIGAFGLGIEEAEIGDEVFLVISP